MAEPRDHTATTGVNRGPQSTRLQGGCTPVWFDYLSAIAVVGVLSFGGFGLLLAVLGHYSATPTLLLGTAGTLVGVALCRAHREREARQSSRAITLPAIGMCVVAAGTAVWNSVDIGHHVIADRDPGVYAITGRWIAAHGNLVVSGGAPWTGKGTSFNWASSGMYGVSGGKLEFQFAHLLPVLLAEGYNLGGSSLMFRVPAILGALALCAIYAVGCRLIRRPWIVLAAVTGLGVSLPQLYFSRDTYSEPATQVLLWGGIWLLIRSYEERRLGVALMAGLALGGTLMTRIDAVAYLISLPVVAAIGWLATTTPSDRRSLLRVYGAVVLGVLPTAILGTFDVQRRASGYYDALHSQVSHLYLGLLATSAVAIVSVIAWRQLPDLHLWLKARRQTASTLAAWVISIGLILTWSLRPAGPKGRLSGAATGVVASLQKAEGLPIHPSRSYSEQSMRWIASYIGPITLALAIAGLCFLMARAIRRGSAATIVVLGITAPLAAIYIWNPNITPDQIWAMRRYVPDTLPLLLLAAAAAVEAVASAGRTFLHSRIWSRRAVVVGAVGMIAFPLGVTLPVRNFQVEANFLPLVARTCHTIGANGAVIFPTADPDGFVLMQTLRSWCNVPAAALATRPSDQTLEAVAGAFHAQGKTLWILAATPTAITHVASGLAPTLIGTASSPRELQPTLVEPANSYSPTTLTVYAAEVPS